MTVSSACADFTVGLSFNAIPQTAITWAKWGILDCTGVAMAGSATTIAAIIEDYLNLVGGNPQARVLGLGLATSAPEAAMANGALCHALDFDSSGGFGHSTTVLLPVIYALCDLVKISGKQALVAYVAGFEVGSCFQSNALVKTNLHGQQLGWHPTGTFGTIGATCTAARLLGLTRDQTMHAIGISASEACGILKNFGTMTKSLHAGIAARNGVFAALLAQRGFTADADALGGEQGFLRAFKGPGDYTEKPITSDLGKSFALDQGLAIKWCPSAGASHGAISGVIDLVRQHALNAADIENIEVALRPIPMLRLNPSTGLEGKFSMAFNVAVAVLKGDWPEIVDYSTARTQESAIRALMQRVRHVDDPNDGSANVAIVVKGGRRVAKNVRHHPGEPALGLQDERNLSKFDACAAYRLTPAAIADVKQQLLNLESVADMSNLVSVLYSGQYTAAYSASLMPSECTDRYGE